MAQEKLLAFLQSTGFVSSQQAPEIAARFVPKTLTKHYSLLREGQVGDEYLLLTVVVNAVLSAPTVVQQLAFDQPNVAILYCPFIALPSCLVPLVALSHLAAIRRLVRDRAAAVIPT